MPAAAPPDGDLLHGSRAIHNFLVQLGMPERENFDYLYYLKRAGRWPIGNTGGGTCGGRLISSKRQLIEHINKITRNSPPLGPNRIVTKFRFDRRAKKTAADTRRRQVSKRRQLELE
jgi:hypothetical protein